MKIEYINPFIESVFGLFTTMLECPVERGQLSVASETWNSGDVTAIIGLSGLARGTVALSFPRETAVAMVSRLLQIDKADAGDSITDGVAELVNIVAGSAKAKFSTDNSDSVISLGLPTVIQGKEYTLGYPPQATWLDVPFDSDLGAFSMRVTFDLEVSQKGKAA